MPFHSLVIEAILCNDDKQELVLKHQLNCYSGLIVFYCLCYCHHCPLNEVLNDCVITLDLYSEAYNYTKMMYYIPPMLYLLKAATWLKSGSTLLGGLKTK